MDKDKDPSELIRNTLPSGRQQPEPARASGQQYENTDSAAKVIDPKGLENTALARAQSLKTAFDRVQSPPRSIQAKRVGGSQAKAPEKTVADRAQSLKVAFNRAQSPTRGVEAERLNGKNEMVAKDAPRHNMHPPSPQRGPDRQAWGEKLNATEQRADALNAELKARHDARQNEKMKDDRDRERD